MLKKKNILVIFVILLVSVPVQAFAQSLKSGEYYPPKDSDYYQKKISWQLYFDSNTVKVHIEQDDLSGNQIYQQDMDVTPNTYKWFDMKCQGVTTFTYYDSSGTNLGFSQRGQDTTNLDGSDCDPSNPVTLSDYNQTTNQYASDTFGGTQSATNDPATPDGSGGTAANSTTAAGTSPTGTGGTTDTGGSSGGSTSGGTSGTDSGSGSASTGTSGSTSTCDVCQMFSCPGWSQYMSGLNDIKNAIPPAPNWDQVAQTFTNTIAPQIQSDLQSVLGSAPDLPSAPAAPSGIDDGGITAPTGNGGQDTSSYNEDTIKNDAPTIKENQDPTGGFTGILNNPVDGLPSQDEFTQNQPSQGDNPTPADPAQGDNIAPTPNEGDNPTPADPTEGDNIAPNPAQGDNIAPTPNEGDNTAPTPSGGDNTAPTPSGGDNTAPLPNDSGTAPLPGDTNDTAPLPNETWNPPLPGQ